MSSEADLLVVDDLLTCLLRDCEGVRHSLRLYVEFAHQHAVVSTSCIAIVCGRRCYSTLAKEGLSSPCTTASTIDKRCLSGQAGHRDFLASIDKSPRCLSWEAPIDCISGSAPCGEYRQHALSSSTSRQVHIPLNPFPGLFFCSIFLPIWYLPPYQHSHFPPQQPLSTPPFNLISLPLFHLTKDGSNHLRQTSHLRPLTPIPPRRPPSSPPRRLAKQQHQKLLPHPCNPYHLHPNLTSLYPKRT